MGAWKEIKYALNRTLGTDKFKPLDQMADDITGDGISIQSATGNLGETLFYLVNTPISLSLQAEIAYPRKVKMNVNGIVTVVSGNYKSITEIYLNGIKQDNNRITFKKGDEFTFVFKRTEVDFDAYVSSVYFRGNIVSHKGMRTLTSS